jgi:hypothetical protein
VAAILIAHSITSRGAGSLDCVVVEVTQIAGDTQRPVERASKRSAIQSIHVTVAVVVAEEPKERVHSLAKHMVAAGKTVVVAVKV